MATIEQRKDVSRVAVLIPAYREPHSISEVVTKAKKYISDVIVVDDASGDQTAERARIAGAEVLPREENGGKGAALTDGFRYVLEKGFDAVITLDADGFHMPEEIPKFLETYERTHLPVLIGNRMAVPSRVPIVRRWSIRMMSGWLYRLLGVYVADPPCGFRFYRCDVLPFLLRFGSSLPAEFETLLNIAVRRIRVGSVRITKHPHMHKSWISPFRDLIRFFRVLEKYKVAEKKSRKKRTSKEDKKEPPVSD
jgi:glycosyltransferase involved in cell wall biosynthesis